MEAPIPIPIIGPIRGEISIAPIITAVELTFRPIEARNMAANKIHNVLPENEIPISMSFFISVNEFRSSFKLNKLLTPVFIGVTFFAI